MKKSYYIGYPRNFSNEYFIVSVETQAEQDVIDSMIRNAPSNGGDVHRISRKEAERLTAANRAAYESGSANYCNPAGATHILPLSQCF